jgi:hypothetical protein
VVSTTINIVFKVGINSHENLSLQTMNPINKKIDFFPTVFTKYSLRWYRLVNTNHIKNHENRTCGVVGWPFFLLRNKPAIKKRKPSITDRGASL